MSNIIQSIIVVLSIVFTIDLNIEKTLRWDNGTDSIMLGQALSRSRSGTCGHIN